MQKIWAHILATEINEPNSISLKTLDTLRNLRKKDADMFIEILSSCFYRGEEILLPNYHEYLDKYGIEYNLIMSLSENGLIYKDTGLGLQMQLCDKEEALFNNNEKVITIKASNNRPYKEHIRAFPLTKVGKELASVIKIYTVDEKLFSIARIIGNNSNIKISVYQIEKFDKNDVFFHKEDLLRL